MQINLEVISQLYNISQAICKFFANMGIGLGFFGQTLCFTEFSYRRDQFANLAGKISNISEDILVKLLFFIQFAMKGLQILYSQTILRK